MKVIVDSRESESRKKIASKHWNIEIQELPIGDYVYKDTVIEYKTMNDFLSSIRDNRLKKETISQAMEYPHHYLLLEGDVDKTLRELDYKGVLFTKAEYNGAITSLLTYTQIIPATNPSHAFRLMDLLFKKLYDGKNRMILPVEKPSTNPVYNYLAGVYKVGDVRASKIIQSLKLNNLEDLLNLTEKDLLNIDGIGKDTARRVMEAIR